jgi:5-methyltetrahydrofolate--homocysteine methyltransferase
MLIGLATIMSGANFVLHMTGIIDSYLTMSYESFMVDLEILQFIRRFMSGIELEDMDTGLKLLSDVGPAGNFLDNEHTFSHYQTAFLSPMFAERNAYETWQQDRGAISIKQKAREEVKKVLAQYVPPPLDPAVEKELLAFIARRKAEIQPEYVLDRKPENKSGAVPVDLSASEEVSPEPEAETPVEAPAVAESYPVDMNVLAQSVIDGDAPIADRMTREGLNAGMTPEVILEKGLIAGMTVVGILFKNNEIFVPEVLMSARAMKAGMAHLQPLLEAKGIEPLGKYVIGTVKGDLHDIGKNLVAMMLRGAGFEVTDLGVDTSLDKFLAAIEKIQPQIVGMSALLTTTMGQMARNIEAFDKINLRSHLKVMVGGAPLSQEFATKINADAYGKDAADAVGKAQVLVRRVRKLTQKTTPG